MEGLLDEEEGETNGEYIQAKIVEWVGYLVSLVTGRKYEKM